MMFAIAGQTTKPNSKEPMGTKNSFHGKNQAWINAGRNFDFKE